MARKRLPAEIKNALVNVCGRSFWYKQPLFDMFDRAGIPDELYIQFEHESKFKIIRQLFHALEGMEEEGYLLQRRLLTELCKLRGLPDDEVPDRDAGLDALRTLKRLALEHELVTKKEKQETKTRVSQSQELAQRAREREEKRTQLYSMYREALSAEDRQARGYALEDILKELFALYEIRYRKSYKAPGEQIDGFFSFGGFDYLVEARWRKDVPSLQELLAFKGKVDGKIESTRGYFVSVPGFRDDIVQKLRESGPANLLLMDGYDVALILEGRVSLMDALQAKADKASQEGIVYFQLMKLFT
jgi:hypothetical protein